jgi:hypothetical protein
MEILGWDTTDAREGLRSSGRGARQRLIGREWECG